MILELAAHRWEISFTKQYDVLEGQGKVGEHPVLLVLPLRWMNQTGEVLPSLFQRHNCTASDLILVYDDLDLPLGTLKIKTRGGPGGHNGLRSVLANVGNQDFCRLKAGIGRPSVNEDPAHYVLSPFSSDELSTVEVFLPNAVDAIECIVNEGVSVAMNRFHAPPLHQDLEK